MVDGGAVGLLDGSQPDRNLGFVGGDVPAVGAAVGVLGQGAAVSLDLAVLPDLLPRQSGYRAAV